MLPTKTTGVSLALLLLMTLPSTSFAADFTALPSFNTVTIARVPVRPATPKRHYMLLASMGALMLGNTLDCLSSRGKMEANGLFQSSSGQFDMGKAIAFKSLFFGGIMGSEYLMHRWRGHDADTAAAVGNFAMAGALTGAAIHNFGVRPMK